jgi:branched-chain amino acid transport system permease protein
VWLISRILASPFGAALEAVRENETRACACGVDVTRVSSLLSSRVGCVAQPGR